MEKVSSHYNSKISKPILKVPYDIYYFDCKLEDDENNEESNQMPSHHEQILQENDELNHTNPVLQRAAKESNLKFNDDINHEVPNWIQDSFLNSNIESDFINNGYQGVKLKTKIPVLKSWEAKIWISTEDRQAQKVNTAIMIVPSNQNKPDKDKSKINMNAISKILNNHKRKDSKDNKEEPKISKKKRPRSNDDQIKNDDATELKNSKSRKTASQDASDNIVKDYVTTEDIIKRNIVEKYMNNTQK